MALDLDFRPAEACRLHEVFEVSHATGMLSLERRNDPGVKDRLGGEKPDADKTDEGAIVVERVVDGSPGEAPPKFCLDCTRRLEYLCRSSAYVMGYTFTLA